jgi:FKBP-type peptidyl-prolyl cis-trans isomerase FklB
MEKGMTPLRWLALGLLSVAAAAPAQQRLVAPGTQPVKLDRHKLSYAIGYQIGSQFADGEPAVDLPTMQQAIRDAFGKRPPAVSMQDMHMQLRELDRQMHTRAVAEFKHLAAVNLNKSREYMANNARQPGVVQLPSGIQYTVIKKGSGAVSPTVTSTVTVNYRGMLIDGTEFDSTWARGQPVRFEVDKVISGWQDVIPRMHVGDRWKVVIPPQLAYGEHGALPRIGPNEALVFEIELLDIKSGPDNH